MNRITEWLVSNRGVEWFTIVVIPFAAVYLTKFILHGRMKKKLAATAVYTVVTLGLLPYLYWADPWPCPNRSRMSELVGTALTILLIPTVSFLWDLCTADRPKSGRWFLVRSVIEIVIFFPVWRFVMFFVEGSLDWLWL